LDLLLIPRLGINGAAIASSISYTLSSVLTIQQASKWSGVPMWSSVKLPSRDEFQLIMEGLRFLTGLVKR
jgi:Na+-driven multidrug efflux pump